MMHAPARHNLSKGYSLVELAVALAIISLLVGGVLVGRNLIRATELKSVLTELETYRSALSSFIVNYNALPGDMPRATDVWGATDATPADCITTSSLQLQTTCDGDGDGQIGASDPTDNTDTDQHERFHAWQQLAVSGAVSGSYSGISGKISDGGSAPGSYADAVVGENIPASDFNNSGWNLYYVGTLSGADPYFDGRYGHVLSLGRDNAATSGAAMNGGFTPQEAWNIDDKTDDGKPGAGNVVAYNQDQCAAQSDGSANPASTDAATAIYNRAASTEKCALIFRNLYLR